MTVVPIGWRRLGDGGMAAADEDDIEELNYCGDGEENCEAAFSND